MTAERDEWRDVVVPPSGAFGPATARRLLQAIAESITKSHDARTVLYADLHRELHRLWTKAVGTPGYVKAEWQALEKFITQVRDAD